MRQRRGQVGGEGREKCQEDGKNECEKSKREKNVTEETLCPSLTPQFSAYWDAYGKPAAPQSESTAQLPTISLEFKLSVIRSRPGKQDRERDVIAC